MIKNLESPILILHQESALFTMECLLFTMEGLQFWKTCVRNQHKSIKTQLVEHKIEWKAIIITLIEMSGRKRKQLTLGSWKGFKKLVQHRENLSPFLKKNWGRFLWEKIKNQLRIFQGHFDGIVKNRKA